jgi:hypothetical protein
MNQNQSPSAIPNVLHDQGSPNTLGGIGLALPADRFRLSSLAIAAAVGSVAVLLVVLVLLLGNH